MVGITFVIEESGTLYRLTFSFAAKFRIEATLGAARRISARAGRFSTRELLDSSTHAQNTGDGMLLDGSADCPSTGRRKT
jgi:hypothetical protein